MLKPVFRVGSSLRDLRSFPDPVQDHVGYALWVAQRGGKHPDAKALAGFADGVYVLHVFQKKSKTGRATLRGDLDLVRLRLREAERMAREMKP